MKDVCKAVEVSRVVDLCVPAVRRLIPRRATIGTLYRELPGEQLTIVAKVLRCHVWIKNRNVQQYGTIG